VCPNPSLVNVSLATYTFEVEVIQRPIQLIDPTRYTDSFRETESALEWANKSRGDSPSEPPFSENPCR
jgi:hypothetical protein